MRRFEPAWCSKVAASTSTGQGILLTTEECLLSPVQARNPGYLGRDIEARCADYLARPAYIWLRNGIAGDDTHGHIDDLARFTTHEVVIANRTGSSRSNIMRPAGESRAAANLAIRTAMPLRIETLPHPEPVYFDGQRLPASYANFYIANQMCWFLLSTILTIVWP